MIDLGPVAVTCILFGSLVVLMMIGVPVVFALGGISMILVFLLYGPDMVPYMLVSNAYLVTSWYSLIALPLFMFMAMMLRASGVTEDLFKTMRMWFGGIPGGLAQAVIVVSVIIAAMQGTTAMGVMVMGVIAVPIMLKFGYSKEMAIGPVLSGACLAGLIPPSGQFIIYGAIAGVSVGKLFMGGLIPGLIVAGIFMLYIGIRCYLNPALGPPLPPEERVDWREKFVSLISIVLPALLIVAILGSIFFGIASASEAAGVGAAGGLAIAAIRRKLTWQMVKEACFSTVRVVGMTIWIFVAAYSFKSVFTYEGGPHYIAELVAGLDIDPLATIGIIQVVWIVMGAFIMEIAIQLITLPVFLPIADMLGFSRIWFGVLFMTTALLADLTPPFGFALYYMKAVAPPGISMGDIIRAILPFLPLMTIGVLLVMFIPELALWLPGQMIAG